MKLILATIQPTKLRALKVALAEIGVERLTICDSQEYRDQSPVPILRGRQQRARVFRKVTLEIAVNNDFLKPTVDLILRVARTGKLGNDGDGQISVLPLVQVLDIAQGTSGPGAI
jgi:nitrogen regulatory protein P-II 1